MTWLEVAGSSSRTSTPRRAASMIASTKSGSGMKYACVIQMWCEARVTASRYIDADREHPQPRHVAVHPDPGLPVGRRLQQQRPGPVPRPPVQVPEVGEGAVQVEDTGAGDPDVGVAPLGRVRGPDVVAADEPHLVVDDQDLAVVAAVAAQVEEPPPGVVDGVLQHLQTRANRLNSGDTTRFAKPS